MTCQFKGTQRHVWMVGRNDDGMMTLLYMKLEGYYNSLLNDLLLWLPILHMSLLLSQRFRQRFAADQNLVKKGSCGDSWVAKDWSKWNSGLD